MTALAPGKQDRPLEGGSSRSKEGRGQPVPRIWVRLSYLDLQALAQRLESDCYQKAFIS